MFVESALVYSGSISYEYIPYYNSGILNFPPEIWRLFTSFLLTGPGFSFVFDLFFSKLGHDGIWSYTDKNSVDLQYRTRAQLSSIQSAWRFFYLCCFRGLSHSRRWPSFLTFPSTLLSPHISARPAQF